MKSESFADILKEKIEKSKIKDTQTPSISSPTNSTLETWTSRDNLDLSQLHTHLLAQNPLSFQYRNPKHVKQSAYNQFKQQDNGQETSHRSQSQPTQSGQNRQPPLPKQRTRTAAHKLSPEQTKAMTYFISEKMFLLEDFTREELKKAYRRLALRKHPDRQMGSNQFFVELQNHYKILSTVPKY